MHVENHRNPRREQVLNCAHHIDDTRSLLHLESLFTRAPLEVSKRILGRVLLLHL